MMRVRVEETDLYPAKNQPKLERDHESDQR